jgi:hypothetical protein
MRSFRASRRENSHVREALLLVFWVLLDRHVFRAYPDGVIRADLDEFRRTGASPSERVEALE